MSFSSTVKNELCRVNTSDSCCLLAEMAAIIRLNGAINYINDDEINVKIATENAAFARNIFSIIKKLYDIYPEIIIRKSKKLKKHTLYILVITASKQAKLLIGDAGISCREEKGIKVIDYASDIMKVIKKNCCKKAYLRGAFLSGGSVSDPEKTYHLEITNHSLKLAVELNRIMNSFRLNAKIIKRKGNYVTYLKEGENIVDFLNIIGAHAALLELENVRILKEMRNNVNRIVNCETANLEKTVNASIRQVENIRHIRDHIGFDKLPDNLREIAELRLAYSDANLKELGEMLTTPLGKSGVNHRLRKLDMIAETDRLSKGEQ